MGKDLPPPLGCTRRIGAVFLGFPVLLLVVRIEEPWHRVLQQYLSPLTGEDFIPVIHVFSLLAFLLAGWMAVLKIVDRLFGTRLFPYGYWERVDTRRPDINHWDE